MEPLWNFFTVRDDLNQLKYRLENEKVAFEVSQNEITRTKGLQRV